MAAVIPELDTLTEIANIGMSRAAAQLSMLLNDSVEVGVPKIDIAKTWEVGPTLGLDDDEEVACVWQQLDGDLNGKAMLLFHTEESKALVNALIGTVPTMTDVDMRKYEHEAMTEIGNIILSSGTATIADMLDNEITLSVPVYIEEPIGELIKNHLSIISDHADRVVIFSAKLNAVKRKVSGDLIILLGVRSIDQLLQKARDYLNKELEKGNN